MPHYNLLIFSSFIVKYTYVLSWRPWWSTVTKYGSPSMRMFLLFHPQLFESFELTWLHIDNHLKKFRHNPSIHRNAGRWLLTHTMNKLFSVSQSEKDIVHCMFYVTSNAILRVIKKPRLTLEVERLFWHGCDYWWVFMFVSVLLLILRKNNWRKTPTTLGFLNLG